MLGWHVVASYHDCVACSATTVSSLVTVHEQMLFFSDDTVRRYEHVNNLRKSTELFFLKNSEKMKIVRSIKIYFFPGKYQTKTEAKRYKYMEHCRTERRLLMSLRLINIEANGQSRAARVDAAP